MLEEILVTPRRQGCQLGHRIVQGPIPNRKASTGIILFLPVESELAASSEGTGLFSVGVGVTVTTVV